MALISISNYTANLILKARKIADDDIILPCWNGLPIFTFCIKTLLIKLTILCFLIQMIDEKLF